MILAGTDNGLHAIGGGIELEGRRVHALAHDGARLWALADGRALLRRMRTGWERVARATDATCLLAAGRTVLVGTQEAHVARLTARPDASSLARVRAFEGLPTRAKWYTPWGGPPAVRSIARGAGGAIYVNVHVGGILRSRDGGKTFEQTSLDIDADVHQVIAHPTDPRIVLAACAEGLATSTDGGEEWEISHDGLHGSYSRAVALGGSTVFVTASESYRGRRSSVYRRLLRGGAFERCIEEWFSPNIDTACLAAARRTVVFGTEQGKVYRSSDGGRTWLEAASGLPPVRCVLIEP